MALIERSRRVGPRFRRVAIAVFVLVLPFALHALWDYVEARRLARLVAELNARHEPVAVLPTMSVEMGDARNAARFYDAAAALAVDTRGLYAPGGIIHEVAAPGTAGRDRALVRVRSWLVSNADAESMLARATAQEFLGYPAGTDYNFRWDRLWMLANLIDLRTLERVAAEDGEGALRAAIQQIKLGRAFEATDAAGPIQSVWSYPLIARAVDGARAAISLHPSDEALRDAQLAFREHDVDSALEQIVLQTRAQTLGFFWDASREWYARSPGRALTPPLWGLVRPVIAHRVIRHVHEMDGWLQVSRRPWPDRLHTPVTPAPRKPPVAWYRMLEEVGRVNLYAMGDRFRGVGAALASIRTLDAALAVERYRLAHGGRPPGALADLVPSFLPAIPVDPYSGTPIKYSVTAGRYVVYSVGPDEKDNGGADIVWPKRPRSLYLSATPPPDIGVERSLSTGRTP